MAAPFLPMNGLRSIGFSEALRRLHELIGSKVQATVNCGGQFFGCGMQGELLRVEFLPPDHSAISLVLAGGHGVFLDPAETEVFAGEGEDGGFLEFHAACGISLLVEPAPREE
jgi:hypothetical protein